VNFDLTEVANLLDSPLFKWVNWVCQLLIYDCLWVSNVDFLSRNYSGITVTLYRWMWCNACRTSNDLDYRRYNCFIVLCNEICWLLKLLFLKILLLFCFAVVLCCLSWLCFCVLHERWSYIQRTECNVLIVAHHCVALWKIRLLIISCFQTEFLLHWFQTLICSHSSIQYQR